MSNRGFEIVSCHGDNEFNIVALHEAFPGIIFEIYGRNEHVGLVERSVRTMRDRA